MKCGAGSISKDDSLAACTEIGSGPKDCNVVTVSGGSWTVWCDPGKGIYVWATIEGLSQTSATECVGSIPHVDQDYAAFSISGGGSGGGGTVHQITSPPPLSSSATYELQRPTPTTAGQGTLVFGAKLAVKLAAGTSCRISNDSNSKLAAGFHIRWN